MTLDWAQNLEMIGIGFGYTSHQKQLKKALEGKGVKFGESDVAVSIIPAGQFVPREGKYNVLYTMYESTAIPPKWPERLDQADLIVVPCKHNKDLLERYTDTPVEVCWEGVRVDLFEYKERKFPKSRPFTYLWFGANNERKGYKHMIIAWQLFQHKRPDLIDKVQLVMKTTQEVEEIEVKTGYDAKGKPIKSKMPGSRICNVGENAIVDTRVLPMHSKTEDSLVSLYHYAHAFVFPSMGEGFGLTLAEAMATGLPCIYTDWSGPKDFCSKREGYPLKFKFVPVKAWTWNEEEQQMKVEFETSSASADVDHIVRRMEQVYHGYDRALEKGRLAAERIRKYITWERSADSFIKIIEKYTSERL